MGTEKNELLPWEIFVANQDRSETKTSVTNIRGLHKNFQWQINGINTCRVSSLQSSTFEVRLDEQHNLCLEIFCTQGNFISDGYMNFHLKHSTPSQVKITVSYVILVRDVKHKILGTLYVEAETLYDSKGQDLVLNEKILPINNNILIVELHLSFLKTPDTKIVENENILMQPNVTTTLDFSSFLNNDSLSDIVLKSNNGEEIPAHKCLLATGSPVFAAMFEHEMKGSREKCVQIDDADSDTIRALLKFIYTGKFESEVHGKEQVLAIADKYGVKNLLDLCEYEMCKKMTVENVANMLALANMHNLKSLKKRSCIFIGQYMKSGLNSDLKDVLSKYPDSFEEILLNS